MSVIWIMPSIWQDVMVPGNRVVEAIVYFEDFCQTYDIKMKAFIGHNIVD